MSTKNKGKLWNHAWKPALFYTKCKYCGIEIKLIPATHMEEDGLHVQWDVMDITGRHKCTDSVKVKPTW